MLVESRQNSLILGVFIFLGLTSLGFLLGSSAIRFKEHERTVIVKGLSQKEVEANVVIWPIQFTVAENNLEKLYEDIEGQTAKISEFLEENGINKNDISFTTPSIADKLAQQYGNVDNYQFRYTAIQTVTVYSSDIISVKKVMDKLSDLGKQGIVFTSEGYQYQTEYLFTRLNEIKPEMIEGATREAREVAEKFASDSRSTLGKIRKATQGQFSIHDRDKNNPHIKNIRVVSTVEYYLSD